MENQINGIYLIFVLFFIVLLKRWFNGTSCKSKRLLTGKTAIVTGSNTGIGFQTALDFARRDSRVILACLDLEKAKEAANRISRISGNSKVEAEKLDLADLKSVRKFSERMHSKLGKLDILVNNAGIMATPAGSKTKDGFELQFGTNHLGPFLLTNLLLDLLKKSEDGRIVNVSSCVHSYAKMKWDDLNSEKSYSPTFAYAHSKLATILFTRELTKRLQGTSCTAYSLHPGAVRTEITDFKNSDASYKILAAFKRYMFYPLWYFISKSSKQGAQTSIFCAITDEARQYAGCYFSDCEVTIPSKEARDTESPKRLWEISEKLVNL